MDVVIEFLRENWRFVAEILLTVIVLLVSIFRKKVKLTQHGFSSFLQILPEIIVEAEKIYGSGHGNEKFSYVLDRSQKLLSTYYDDQMVTFYLHQVEGIIENILETPQKKER